MPAVNITDFSGKHPAVPMKPKGAAGMKEVKTESGDPQRAALAQTVRDAVPSIPYGGKVSILA